MQHIHAEDINSNFNVAIVVSRFNSDVTDKLRQGAIERLEELGFTADQITVVQVPGAVEIPITAQHLAQTGRYAAIIALGAVIKGETYHMEYVCDQVTQGCLQVMLKHNLPVIYGVLTTENRTQALERAGGSHSHAGRDAADTAYEMVSILGQIR